MEMFQDFHYAKKNQVKNCKNEKNLEQIQLNHEILSRILIHHNLNCWMWNLYGENQFNFIKASTRLGLFILKLHPSVLPSNLVWGISAMPFHLELTNFQILYAYVSWADSESPWLWSLTTFKQFLVLLHLELQNVV